jgi:hypothetical protein
VCFGVCAKQVELSHKCGSILRFSSSLLVVSMLHAVTKVARSKHVRSLLCSAVQKNLPPCPCQQRKQKTTANPRYVVDIVAFLLRK